MAMNRSSSHFAGYKQRIGEGPSRTGNIGGGSRTNRILQRGQEELPPWTSEHVAPQVIPRPNPASEAENNATLVEQPSLQGLEEMPPERDIA